jgi:uncharacterized protein YciI
MQHFLFRLNGPRPSFPADMTEGEAQAMLAHRQYWEGRIADRTALLFGPVFDPSGPWGLAIIEAADESAARRVIEADPVLMAGIGFSYAIFPMQIGAIRGETT